MVEVVTRAGQTNERHLLSECSDELWNNKGSQTTRARAVLVINVLRRRGLLNDQGVELCRSELGPLSVAVIKGDKDE